MRQKLGVQTTYVIVRDAADGAHNNSLDIEYAVLLQVVIVPITINLRHALSVELATEIAAKNVLHLSKIISVHSL